MCVVFIALALCLGSTSQVWAHESVSFAPRNLARLLNDHSNTLMARVIIYTITATVHSNLLSIPTSLTHAIHVL